MECSYYSLHMAASSSIPSREEPHAAVAGLPVHPIVQYLAIWLLHPHVIGVSVCNLVLYLIRQSASLFESHLSIAPSPGLEAHCYRERVWRVLAERPAAELLNPCASPPTPPAMSNSQPQGDREVLRVLQHTICSFQLGEKINFQF